jgi:hypothetical protein
VAAQAALIRAAYPHLSSAQVVRRIKATADKLGDDPPNAKYGWGMINPVASVTRALPDEDREDGGVRSSTRPGGSFVVLAMIAILGLASVVLLALRRRRLTRASPSGEPIS